MADTPSVKQDNSLDELMTLQEIARLLKVSERTVLRMTKTGDIPAGKVAGQWRFSRIAIDAWLTERVKSRSSEELVEVVGTQKVGVARITDMLPPEHVILDLTPGSKEDILRQLVVPLIQKELVRDPEHYLELLLSREALLSTAVAEGIALPHAREADEAGLRETCLVLGISKQGLDFDSLDGSLTHLFFLVGSASVSSHLRLLAKITLMLRTPGVAQGLVNSQTQEEVRRFLTDAQVDLSIRL